jgi:hypothetical protein
MPVALQQAWQLITHTYGHMLHMSLTYICLHHSGSQSSCTVTDVAKCRCTDVGAGQQLPGSVHHHKHTFSIHTESHPSAAAQQSLGTSCKQCDIIVSGHFDVLSSCSCRTRACPSILHHHLYCCVQVDGQAVEWVATAPNGPFKQVDTRNYMIATNDLMSYFYLTLPKGKKPSIPMSQQVAHTGSCDLFGACRGRISAYVIMSGQVETRPLNVV